MKKVIYTAIANDYDSLKEPLIISRGWDYICYTNNPHLRSIHWNIIYLPTLNTVKQVRELKIVPLFDYDECIWIDGSIEIRCDLNKFVENWCKRDLTLMKHPQRNCIYEEAIACIKRKKDDPTIINNQMQIYKANNYPENNGLVATGLIYRKFTNELKKFCKKWNSHVQAYSLRDQLSFNFVARSYKQKFHLIPFNILQTDFFLHKHINR